MKIEKIIRYYGYDLMINEILHKKCLKCDKWYKFEKELGYCQICMKNFLKLEQARQHTFKY